MVASQFRRKEYEKEAKRHADEGIAITVEAKKITEIMFSGGKNTPISPEEFRASFLKTDTLK